MSQRGAILLVEDDEDIRESLRELLEIEGYSIITAQNGRQALDVLRSGSRIELVLLDMMMPGMSGGEVVEEIRKDPLEPLAQIPIVILTAASSGVEQLTGRVEGYMKKPMILGELLELVSKYCVPPRPL